MASVVDALGGQRVIAEWPCGLTQWLAAGEVLLGEGLKAWAFDAGDLGTLAAAQRVFGRRARLGVRGAKTADEVARAVDAGARFVLSPVTDPALLEASGEVPLALGALTPNEVHRALGLGAQTVQVIPGDSLGMAYARALGEMFAGAELIATGRLEPYQCDMWIDAGASAASLVAGVLFADPANVDLDALRRRAREFARP